MTMNFRNTLMLAIAPVALGLAACSGTDTANDDGDLTTQEDTARTLATLMAGNGDLSSVSQAMRDTGLSTMLDGPSSYTLIAPTNDALSAVEGLDEVIDDQKNAPVVAAILREHIIPGALTPETIGEAIDDKGGAVTMRTLGEGTITFDKDGADGAIVMKTSDGVEARVASAPMVGSNGVLIPVDHLLASLPAA